MGFRTDAYATVWEIQNKGNYHEARITIQRKNKSTGEYEQDFSGFMRMIGTAHTLADDIQARDRIKLGSIDVTNKYDKDTKKTFTNFLCFSFEKVESYGSNKSEEYTSDDDFSPF